MSNPHATPAATGAAPAPAQPPAQRPPVLSTDADILRTARALAAQFGADALARDRDRRLPWHEVDAFSASGLWGITVPREYGGPAASAWTVAQVFSIISAADPNLAHIPQNHFYALEVLRIAGTHEQKQFFYDRVLRGERFGNALAETGHRDFVRRTTLTRHTSDDWRIDGIKNYCTGAIFSHWIPTHVATNEDGKRVEYLVMVPRNAEGVEIVDDWDGFGQRVTGSGTVRFENVRVDPQWVLPFSQWFVEHASTIGPFAQILHAAIDVGGGHGAFAATLDFVREHARAWIDANVERAGDDPLLLREIGNVHVRLRAADALIERAARFVDAAQAAPDEDSVAAASIAVAEAKALSTQAGLLAANKLLELGGSASTLAEHGFDRFWRNVRTHTLHDPVRWKYHAIGNHALNAKRPPRHGAI